MRTNFFQLRWSFLYILDYSELLWKVKSVLKIKQPDNELSKVEFMLFDDLLLSFFTDSIVCFKEDQWVLFFNYITNQMGCLKCLWHVRQALQNLQLYIFIALGLGSRLALFHSCQHREAVFGSSSHMFRSTLFKIELLFFFF